ncbi:hypothetical protein F4861DRAFT_135485 [Xylaria intraflava]|nr:hypothetical protein F4861DRAFT_135485 [Xylaria intraflava]
MADHPRRGRNRPDSRTAWDESDRRSRYGGATRDRRDDRDRYRDDRARSRDRRQRSRSRSPVTEPRERYRSRSRSRDRRDKTRRRGYDNTHGGGDSRHHERDRETDRERDGRRRDDGREDNSMPRARRGDHRRSISPPRSPLKNLGRSKHDDHSPLPTRSKNAEKGPAHSSARGDQHNDDSSRKGNLDINRNVRDSSEDDESRGRRPNREKVGSDDAMDEDDGPPAEDDEMSAMQAMMGFGGFGSTKGQKVPGNNAGGVYKAKKTEYRQYMNRVGGFNRPLSPGR